MCKHKNIVVIHYANEETNGFMGCEVRCYDCDDLNKKFNIKNGFNFG